MLTFTEEILLLLGDEDGALFPIRQHAFECALAGAVLIDLAFANLIDTDLAALRLTDPVPIGNPMLDRVLAKIGERPDTTDAPTWIRLLSTGGRGHHPRGSAGESRAARRSGEARGAVPVGVRFRPLPYAR